MTVLVTDNIKSFSAFSKFYQLKHYWILQPYRLQDDVTKLHQPTTSNY